MDNVLLFLINKGALRKPIHITTKEIGQALGMTQQNASYRLFLLEKKGYIKRQDGTVVLDAAGREEASKVYAILRAVFDKDKNIFRGTIRNGLGEGRYYLSIQTYKNNISAIVGFIPYRGTLNIELDEDDLWIRDFMLANSIEIPSFQFNGRVFGSAKVFFPCFIEGKKCAAIFPCRTHHKKNIVEFIAEVHLRKLLQKKEGEVVRITLGKVN